MKLLGALVLVVSAVSFVLVNARLFSEEPDLRLLATGLAESVILGIGISLVCCLILFSLSFSLSFFAFCFLLFASFASPLSCLCAVFALSLRCLFAVFVVLYVFRLLFSDFFFNSDEPAAS